MLDRVFRRVTLIQIVTLLTAVISMLVDSIIIAKYLGVTCVAAYGLAAPILTLFAAIGGTFAQGAQTTASKALGTGDTDLASRLLSVAVLIGLIVSILGTVLVIVIANPIALAFGAGESSELLSSTVGYIRGYILGAPGLVLLLILLPFMQLDGDRNRAIVGAIAMTIVDIALDLMNVFLFKGGMFGMGLASAASAYVALVILLLHFIKKNIIFRLSFKKIDKASVKPIVMTGMPYALGQLCRTFLVITLNRLFLWVSDDGSTTIAAFSVVNTVYSVMCIPGSAVGTAAVMVAGIMSGEENKSGLKETMQAFLKYALVLNVIVTALVLLFAPNIIGIFLHDNPETLSIAVTGTRFVAVSMILAAVTGGFRNFYQGVGRTKLTGLLCILNTYVFIVVPAVILGSLLGTKGIWIAFLVVDVLVMITIFIVNAIYLHRIPTHLMDFSMLPADFGVTDEDLKEYSPASMDEVMEASLGISEFCKEHGADLRTRMTVSLAIEEMGANVMSHKAKTRGKKHYNVRVFIKNGSWTVRMQDDYPTFNPKEYVEIYEKSDKTDVIGLKMIMGLARDVQYLNTLDLNNLIISI